ncbi:MAG: rRNA pseudouridine synthase [Treponema sp.]|nr:rRNA pseudouridine synthase [Treponema sp.]
MRLQSYVSRSGVSSRRAAEEIIVSGRIKVNGEEVREKGHRLNEGDVVEMDGAPLKPDAKRIYLALNKPPGYICSAADPQGRPLALSLLPASGERLYSLGRLDFMSCGLIFFTNDGDFAAKLGHPGFGMEKEYLVEATGHIDDGVLRAFERGIEIDGEHYVARRALRHNSRTARIVLVEGKNREIRRVFSHFHLHPRSLRRVRIGCVRLGDLAEGSSRELTAEEVAALLEGKNALWAEGDRRREERAELERERAGGGQAPLAPKPSAFPLPPVRGAAPQRPAFIGKPDLREDL